MREIVKRETIGASIACVGGAVECTRLCIQCNESMPVCDLAYPQWKDDAMLRFIVY